jgi:hypothetical protein
MPDLHPERTADLGWLRLSGKAGVGRWRPSAIGSEPSRRGRRPPGRASAWWRDVRFDELMPVREFRTRGTHGFQDHGVSNPMIFAEGRACRVIIAEQPCPGEAGALPAGDRALLAGKCPGLAGHLARGLTLVILVGCAPLDHLSWRTRWMYAWVARWPGERTPTESATGVRSSGRRCLTRAHSRRAGISRRRCWRAPHRRRRSIFAPRRA